MNPLAFQPILAHGETMILPAFMLMAAVVGASLWTLVASLTGRRRLLFVPFALILILVGVAALIEVVSQISWPPESGELTTLLFWSLPLFSGIVALVQCKRTRNP